MSAACSRSPAGAAPARAFGVVDQAVDVALLADQACRRESPAAPPRTESRARSLKVPMPLPFSDSCEACTKRAPLATSPKFQPSPIRLTWRPAAASTRRLQLFHHRARLVAHQVEAERVDLVLLAHSAAESIISLPIMRFSVAVLSQQVERSIAPAGVRGGGSSRARSRSSTDFSFWPARWCGCRPRPCRPAGRRGAAITICAELDDAARRRRPDRWRSCLRARCSGRGRSPS